VLQAVEPGRYSLSVGKKLPIARLEETLRVQNENDSSLKGPIRAHPAINDDSCQPNHWPHSSDSCAGGVPDHAFEIETQSTPRSSASVHTLQKSESADFGRWT
jgi:hypothetical protein